MINPEKYVLTKIVKSTKDYTYDDYVKAIEEVQKDAYNQALTDVLENVEIERYETGFGGSHYNECSAKTFEIGQKEFVSIDAKSILKLKK